MPTKLVLLRLGSYLLSACLFFVLSCSDKQTTDQELLRLMRSGIDECVKVSTKNTQLLYEELEKRKSDPFTETKAAIWLPRALQLHKIIEDTCWYLETLRNELLDGKLTHIRKEKVAEVVDKINHTRAAIYSIDSSIMKNFGQSLVCITAEIDTLRKNKEYIIDHFFTGQSIQSIAGFLSAVNNNLRLIENKLAYYFLIKVPEYEEYYESYAAIVGQNSSYIKAGGSIEIQAGVGIFSRVANAEIIMNGKPVSLSVDGTATYKFKAGSKPGNYYVPVSIAFTDMYSKRQVITKKIEYTVQGECP